MTRLRSIVFASYMLAFLSATGCVKIWNEHAERPMENSNNCKVSGPIAHALVKMWLKESNQTIVCKPCRMQYQTYVNCSKCPIAEDPVCDDQSLTKVKNDYLINPYQRLPQNDSLPILSQLILFRTNASQPQMEDTFQRNLIYSIYAISHSPLFTFVIENCGSSSKHFTQFETKLVLRAIDIFKMEFSELFSLEKNAVKMMHKPYISDYSTVKQETDEMDQILHRLCHSEVLNKKQKTIKRSLHALNGIKSRLSPLRQRRGVWGSEEEDNLFKITNKVSKTKLSTTRFPKRYRQRSTMKGTVKSKAFSKHFRRTGKQSAGKKHPHRVRGKKHRDFNKNLKHGNGSINFRANVKSSDKEGTKATVEYNNVSADNSSEKSDKINATTIKSENGVSLSEISTDVSATSSFSSHMSFTGSTTEASLGMNSSYYQQFNEQTSQNSSGTGETQLDFTKGITHQETNESYNATDDTEHDGSQLENRKTTELDSSFKLSPTAENSGIESSLLSNVSDISSDFSVDPDMSSNDAFKYRKDIHTAETSDQTAENTSPITVSNSLDEVKGTVNPVENLEQDGVNNTNIFINMSSSVTGERLVTTDSLTTSKGENVADELGVRSHTDRKFLPTSLDQSGSNYVTDQDLLNNASSGLSTKIDEIVKENNSETVSNFKDMPLGNISEGQEDHSNTLSTVPEHDFSFTTENKIPDNESNGDISTIANKYTECIKNENGSCDTEIGNSRNLTHSSSPIPSTRNGTEEYLTENGTYEYKLEENQTLTMSQANENFPTVTSNFPDQEQQISSSNTFTESENYRSNVHFRHKQLNFFPANKNEGNQTVLETSEYTGINRPKEKNTTGTVYDTIENVDGRVVNNTSDELKINNRVPEGTETNHGDNLYGHFSGNENKGLPFSYEQVTKLDERNDMVGFKSNHMFNPSTAVLPHISGKLSKTSSNQSISHYVDEQNFSGFKDSPIEKTLSELSIDQTNIQGPHNYRAAKDEEDGFKSSTTFIHDNTNFNENQATVKLADTDDNGMKESYNPEPIPYNIRYKRDQLVTKKGSKSIKITNQNSNVSQDRNVLLIEELSIPSTVVNSNSEGHHTDKYIHIPKKSNGVYRSSLNSSDLEKNKDMPNNGTTKKFETANKKTLKSKNLRKKYKSQNAQCVGSCKNANEISTVAPHLKKDHNEHPKSIKANQYSDDHSSHVIKKQLNSSAYEKNQSVSHPLKKLTESTKHNLPTNENGLHLDLKGISVKQNLESSHPKSRQQYLLKENSKDTLLEKANEKTNNAENELIDPKFRTGRKLFHFSRTGDKKLVVHHFWNPLSLRRRRSAKDGETSWCNLPENMNFKRVDCTVWTYQKKCVVSCNSQAAKETIYTCARKKNAWEPKIQSCADGVDNIDLNGYQPANENKKYPADSNKSAKSQATKPPSDDNASDYYEYEDYQYQEVEGNQLPSDKKSGGQKRG